MWTDHPTSRRPLWLLLLLTASVFLPFTAAAQTEAVVGDWTGELTVPGGSLPLVLHLEADGDGLKATMDSPNQGAMGIPVTEASFENGKLTVKVAALSGVYKGELKDDGTLEGTWSQGPATLPLNLKRQTEPIAPKRPQEPQGPFPYEVTDVTFENRRDSVTLAGTWTKPQGEGPFPAAILISGSGPQDRDEQLMGHRPFWVLADHLTRQGIAVLRYDDRGTAESTGDFAAATSEDFAEDTRAAVRFLKQRPEVASIFLVGHSEGGLIAPMVAADTPDVDGIVLMAGPGTSGRQILLDQTERMMAQRGMPKEALETQRQLQGTVFDRIADGNDVELRKAIQDLIRFQTGGALTDRDLKTQVDANLKQMTSPWLRYFLTYDPVPTLRKVSRPVLAINGEKDLQVLPAANLGAIGETLKKAGNENVKLMELKGLNHLFQTAETGAAEEYSKIEETFAPQALEAISSWILEVQEPNEE